MELYSTKTELKNSMRVSTTNWTKQKKESVKSKTDHLQLASQRSKKEKRIKRNEESLRYLWDTIKRNKLCISEVQEEERVKGAENLFLKIMAETSQICGKIWTSKFMKLIGPQINSIQIDLLQDTE